VTGRQVRRWIWKWYLWTEHRRVPVESLALFVKDSVVCCPPERMPVLKKWLGELVDESAGGRARIPEGVAANWRDEGTVRDCFEGWLRRSARGDLGSGRTVSPGAP